METRQALRERLHEERLSKLPLRDGNRLRASRSRSGACLSKLPLRDGNGAVRPGSGSGSQGFRNFL